MNEREIFETLTDARNLAKRNFLHESEQKYLLLITELDKSANTVSGKAKLWSTKAEYLWLRSQYFTNGEAIESSRERKLAAIRLLWQTASLGALYESKFKSDAKSLVKETILSVGCVVPEDASGVRIECPIKIRNMGAGQYGFSLGAFYEKAICSICGRDVVKDMNCPHIPGEKYAGQECRIKRENFKFDHIAMTTRPKNANTGITMLSIPKDEVYSNFTREQIRKKQTFGLPFVCSLCMKEGVDPIEIGVEKFFQMQGLTLS